MPWAICLVVLSIALIFAGITTAVFELRRKGPSILDEFVGSLRDNPYAHIDAKSTEDGVDLAKRLWEMRVQLGDVKPDDTIGYVAVAVPSASQPVDCLQRRRRYA